MQKNLCVAVVDLRKAFCIPEDGKVLAKYFSLLLSWTLWASAASLRCWRSPPTEETEPHLPSYSSDQTDADFFSRNFLGFISNNRSRLFFWKFHSHLACFLLHIDQSNLHTPLFKVELGSQNPLGRYLWNGPSTLEISAKKTPENAGVGKISPLENTKTVLTPISTNRIGRNFGIS